MQKIKNIRIAANRDEYYAKHNLGAMEKLFADYVNARLDSYLMMDAIYVI